MVANDSKKDGYNLGKNILNKLKAVENKPIPRPPPTPIPPTPVIETSPLVAAIESLNKNTVDLKPLIDAVESTQSEALNIEPIVKAINDIELNFDIDLSAISSQIEAVAKQPPIRIDSLVKAMDRNTEVLKELVDVAKKSKVVKYDDFGRIIEIGFKK